MPLRDGFFSTATQTSCCNRIQRSNRVRLLVVSTHDFPDILLCDNWGFIIITEIYPTVTRNRGNSAFCTVIGFTVTGYYEFLGNDLHGIGK